MRTKRRRSLMGTAKRPRLIVYRSLRYIHAQLVDDTKDRVIFGISNVSKDVRDAVKKAGTKSDEAALIGKSLAEKAKKKKITTVVFDRNGYHYHGRIKALAEGAREGGLKF